MAAVTVNAECLRDMDCKSAKSPDKARVVHIADEDEEGDKSLQTHERGGVEEVGSGKGLFGGEAVFLDEINAVFIEEFAALVLG